MSTIILSIVVIMAIIIVGGYILFVLTSVILKDDKKEKEEKVDVKEEIKDLELRQRVIYNRLRQLDEKEENKEEEIKVVVVEKEPEVQEDAPVEETTEETIEEKEEIKEEPEVQEIEVAQENEEESADIVTENGKRIPSRRRTFALKLSSSTEATKRYFSEITNRLRLYGLTARIGKSKVMFRLKKEVYGRMFFKGKRIVLCLPLDPKANEYDEKVYKQLDLSGKKGYEDLAFGMKITNKKSVELILGLVDEVAKKFGFTANEKFKDIDYVEKYPDIYSDFEKKGYGYLIKTEVLRKEAEIYDDSFADKIIIEEKVEDKKPKRFIKAEVSISDFNNRYTDAETPVNMDRLKASDLIGKNVNYLIVKASERIDKPFTVYAHEFEPDAVKMICMAGGKAIRIEYTEDAE